MRNDEDDVVPSTSTLLFPDLMTREELVAVLRYKFRRIGVNINKIMKLTDDELLKLFKKFAMPKPQRKPCISCKPENGNHSGDVSLNESKSLQPTCSRVNQVNGRRITGYGKRCCISSIEHQSVEKNARNHSPIRFP